MRAAVAVVTHSILESDGLVQELSVEDLVAYLNEHVVVVQWLKLRPNGRLIVLTGACEFVCLLGEALRLYCKVLTLLRQRVVPCLLRWIQNAVIVALAVNLIWKSQSDLSLERLGVYLHLLPTDVQVVESGACSSLSSLWWLR